MGPPIPLLHLRSLDFLQELAGIVQPDYKTSALTYFQGRKRQAMVLFSFYM